MGDFHLHVEGTPVDHAEWGTTEDDFDADALEAAMVASRREVYDQLHDLDAA